MATKVEERTYEDAVSLDRANWLCTDCSDTQPCVF